MAIKITSDDANRDLPEDLSLQAITGIQEARARSNLKAALGWVVANPTANLDDAKTFKAMADAMPALQTAAIKKLVDAARVAGKSGYDAMIDALRKTKTI